MARRVPHSFSTTDEMWEEVTSAAYRQGISQSAVINQALEQFFSTKITRSSWETVDEAAWYDAKKFYTYSQDKNGHSAQVRMWIPKNLAGQIGRIIGSGEIPELRTPQDFYRDALFHRAHVVSEWLDDGELRKEVGMMALQAEEDRIAQEQEDFNTLLESTKRNLETALERGDYAHMEEHLKSRWDHLSSIPARFRDEYEALLKSYQDRVRGERKGRLRAVRGSRAAEG